MADRPVLSFYCFHILCEMRLGQKRKILRARGSTLTRMFCKKCYFHFAYYFEVLSPIKGIKFSGLPEYYLATLFSSIINERKTIYACNFWRASQLSLYE